MYLWVFGEIQGLVGEVRAAPGRYCPASEGSEANWSMVALDQVEVGHKVRRLSWSLLERDTSTPPPPLQDG